MMRRIPLIAATLIAIAYYSSSCPCPATPFVLNATCTPNATANGTGDFCVIEECHYGFMDCNGLFDDGCETEILTNVSACGNCTNNCAAPPLPLNVNQTYCATGVCRVQMCQPGFGNCDGSIETGCETHIDFNPQHCGGCTRSCWAYNWSNVALYRCENGVCQIETCKPGFYHCDGDPLNGCESDRPCCTHIDNCTAVLPPNVGNYTCNTTSRSCVWHACAPGTADCNRDWSDGCEVNTTEHPLHCGACHVECAAELAHAPFVVASQCTNGKCTIAQCVGGHANCGEDPRDGCPVHILLNVSSCGACGHDCSALGWPHVTAYRCHEGACRVAACEDGYFECNGVLHDGCETKEDECFHVSASSSHPPNSSSDAEMIATTRWPVTSIFSYHLSSSSSVATPVQSDASPGSQTATADNTLGITDSLLVAFAAGGLALLAVVVLIAIIFATAALCDNKKKDMAPPIRV